MALWDNKKYDEEATRIAKAFVAGEKQGGSAVTDLVEKTARQNGLNPEQIRRLTRVANIRSWEEKFEGMKTAGATDRNVEFSLGDENAIIRRLHGEAASMVSAAIKTANDDIAAIDFPDLLDAMGDVRNPMPATEKVAAAVPTDTLVTRRPDIEVLKLEKLSDEVEIKIAGARLAWRDAMQNLLDVGRRLTWTSESTSEFEKSAIAIHGTDVLPEINALRRMRGEAVLPLTTEKVAALQDRIYAEPSLATDLVKIAATARQNHAELEAASKNVAKKLSAFRAQLILRQAGG